MRFLSIIAAIAVAGSTLAQNVRTTPVEYKEGSTALQGYVVHVPGSGQKRPGILIVHDWNSIDDYELGRAKQLAQMGYVAFVVDIYGKGVRPKTPQESGAQAGKFKADRDLLRRRILAGLETLRKSPLVDKNKIAAIGYCFGGTTVLELARTGANIDGVVSFHGGLDNPRPQDARNIKAKVLVLHGADDPYVPPAQVQAFEAEMRAARVDWQLVAYGGAVHSFTEPSAGNDPSKGQAYNAKADKRSWEDMRQFFRELFGR